jgi:RimJ/RimL family protein N-acetyltransferase
VRGYHAGDGDALWEAVEESRTHLKPWLLWVNTHRTPVDSEEYARRSRARFALREDFSLGIWERATGRLVGGTGLHPYDWDVPSFEIGYWLRPSAVGNGFVTEAVRLLCRIAFEMFGANRVFIRCDSENARSAAVPRRLGFIQEATLRGDSRNTEGQLSNTLVFAMTSPDYATLVSSEW